MKIIQLHNSTISQMMGYLLITDHGKVIAVDGGTEGDAPEFKRLVRENGGHIDLWFLTHPHHDHHDVFVNFSETPGAGYYGGPCLLQPWHRRILRCVIRISRLTMLFSCVKQ